MVLVLGGIGALLLLYGLYALYTGKVLSTWARWEYRPSTIYWITVVAIIAVGGVNVAWAVRALFR